MSNEEIGLGPGVWQRLLPRSMFRGVVWITVHEGADLQPKMIGTRDPYVKVRPRSCGFFVWWGLGVADLQPRMVGAKDACANARFDQFASFDVGFDQCVSFDVGFDRFASVNVGFDQPASQTHFVFRKWLLLVRSQNHS